MTFVFGYLLRRIAQIVPVLLGIVVLNFFLLHLAPGDAADVIAGEAGSATPEYMAQIRAQFGLDQSLYVQFISYATNILTLNLGYSFRNNVPVLDLIMGRLGPTLLLTGTTFVLSVLVGAGLGLLAAIKVNGLRDNVISIVSVVLYATPVFWIGLMLILVFAVKWQLLPTSGMETVAAFHEGWARVADIARHLVLPTITLSSYYLAVYTRFMRASVLDQTGMDYVLTARGKGATEGRITFHHVLRNAAIPVVSIAGIQVGALLGGSVVVESVFGWPGLGLLAYESLGARDLNLLLGIFFFCAVLVVLANLCVDLIYLLLDPRMQRRD